MRSLISALILLFLLIFSQWVYSQPCDMQGVYKIGPTGNYPTITAAVNVLKINGVGNQVILELQTTYTGTGEVFPLTFNAIPCVDNSKTITVRPETGATNLIITSNISAIVDLNNARYIRFDGRPGGTGTTRALTIASPFNTVVLFRNDASFNNFNYVNIAGGGVQLSTSNMSITNGNNDNIIQNCAIYNSTSLIATGVSSVGSAGKKNANNKILNNLIYNAANGVGLGANNSAWEISGTHIYNTIGSFVSATGIYISDTTSSGFQIHNNFIGGSAPNCGGTANTYMSFTGIKILAGTTAYTSIQGNTVANIKVTSTWQGNYFAAISMHKGKFKCGDVTGNIIGSQATTNNIVVRGEDDFRFYGIVAGDNDFFDGGVDTCYIMNNKIGGLYGYQADFNFSQNNIIAGIYIKSQQSGFAEVSNNTIGSPSTYFSILHTGWEPLQTYGIFDDKVFSQSWQPENKISNNEIVNLAGGAVGIFTDKGKPKILNNVIHHLYGNATLSYPGSPFGISVQEVAPGSLVSGNTIHSLTWIGQSFNNITGIYFAMSRGIIVEKNFIHSFQTNSSTGGYLNGIVSTDNNGKERIQNNMIRLGIDTAGNTTNNPTIHGISIKLDSSVITNNSVFIGGTGNYESAALHIREITAATNSKIRNNIFANTRSTTASTFFNHYALKYEGGFISSNEFNYNIYYATGAGGYIAFLTMVPYQPPSNNFTNIIDWRNASKQDSNSFVYQPNFINPTGNASAVNLHLANPNPAEGQGIADAGVIDDIDNQTRASLSPVDIGADAANFTYQDGDAPRITHKAFLGNPLPTSFVYTVKITDNGSGVDTAGNNKPRMWFRKKYPSIGSWSSLPGNLVSGNLNNGIWGFVPDFAGAGVPVAIGDSLEYYFVAQDKGPIANTGYSNVAGCVHANVNTQTTPPTNPLRLLIYGIFSDTVYVGAGQPFTSLTNDNGFFHFAKFHMFDTTISHPTVIITSDLSESGIHEYTNINESGAVIKFITNTATVKQIKNQTNISKPLITFRNVRNITLDGSVNGSGRYLHFISGHTNRTFTLPALAVYGGGKGLIIRNSIFESNGTANNGESVNFYGNELDTLLIENNLFKNIESSTNATVGLPNTGLSLSVFKAQKIIVRKNEFTNFGQAGLLVTQSIFNPTGEILVDSNHCYYNSAIEPINGRTAINVQVNVKSTITNNYIGGSQPYCGGNPWTYNLQSTASNAVFKGIVVYGPLYITSSVQNNTIQNIRILNWGLNLIGIDATGGSINMGTEQPNLVGSLTGDSSIVNKYNIVGISAYIAINSSDSPYVRIENNTVAGMTAPYIEGINLETRRGTVKNNLVQNLYASGSTLAIPGFKGIRAWLENGVIEGNRVLNLIATQVIYQGWAYGMDLATTGPVPNRILVARNKISGLQSYWDGPFAGGQSIIGLRHQSGQYTLQNNEINITNGSLTNPVDIKGILMEGGTAGVFQSKIYYNTIRIGGSSTANANTYAILFTGGSPVKFFRNNLLYNERIGGTGKHLAIADLSTSSPLVFVPGSGNNNLYIVTDTNYVNEYHTTGIVNIRQWRNLTQSDTASYAARVTDVPVDSLFVSPITGDLNINTVSPKSWYVNGKGLPVDSISGDYNTPTGVRSTSIAGGATDIGADEFNTNTAPPILVVSGNRIYGGTETFSVNGRVVASITWGNTGTLPTLGQPLFYSGVWPNDTTNNGTAHFARFMNSFWSIPATGGSNYSYSITFNYDSSMLGKIINASTMVVNKRQPGINGSWQVIQPTVVNTTLKTITINNQTSFSEFTATDADATLETGMASPDLIITNASLSGAASTGELITANFTEFNQGTAAATANRIHFYLSVDNTLTPGANGDTLIGEYQVTSSLNINTGTGLLNKQLVIPCNLLPGIYSMFFVADGAGIIQELDENNNNAILSVPITIGLTQPATPAITATPGTTICTPQTVTLTANSAGCIGCTYSWSTGAIGNSIIVNTSGTYIVTATNACGQSTSSQQINVNTTPAVTVNPSPSSTTVCLGTPVTFTAYGATTYSWTGNGLNTNSGSVAIATPNVAATYLYSVIGTSNGCSDTLTMSVTVLALPTVSIAQNDTSICNGSSIQLSASGAITYQWSPSAGLNTNNLATVTATPVATTIYSVTGSSAAGCSASDLVTVSLLPTVVPSIVLTYSGCPSNTLNFIATPTNGGSNPQYQWFVSNVAVGTGSTYLLNNALNNTKVRCTLTSNAICATPQTISDSITVGCIPTAVPNIDGLEAYYVAPNPTSGQLFVFLKLNQIKKVSFALLNMHGVKLFESPPTHISGTYTKEINLSAYASGIYYIKVTINNKSVVNKIFKTN